jgi:hypothetical protein
MVSINEQILYRVEFYQFIVQKLYSMIQNYYNLCKSILSWRSNSVENLTLMLCEIYF